MWIGNNLSLGLSTFDDHLAVGIDTKRVGLGINQGNEVKEHLVMAVQGVSGSKTVGVMSIPDGKGKSNQYKNCNIQFKQTIDPMLNN